VKKKRFIDPVRTGFLAGVALFIVKAAAQSIIGWIAVKFAYRGWRRFRRWWKGKDGNQHEG